MVMLRNETKLLPLRAELLPIVEKMLRLQEKMLQIKGWSEHLHRKPGPIPVDSEHLFPLSDSREGREILSSRLRQWMIGPENLLEDLQRPARQRLGFIRPPKVPQDPREN